MEDEKSLIRDLQSGAKSAVLAALQVIISRGGSETLLNALEQLPASGTDEETRLLLTHAVFSVRYKILASPVGGAAEAAPSGAPAAFQTAFLQATPEEKLRLLAPVKGKRINELRDIAPELLAAETHPAVKGMLIRTFSAIWPENILTQFVDLLFAATLGVRTAALETLIHRAPLILKDSLAPLLISPDLRLRALAIQGLGKIDPDEAVLYLESMLLDGDPACRMAALKTVFLMPFERCKGALLKYLSVEKDLEGIKSTGLLFRMNPDPEIPFRLWEIAERSEREKAATLKAIISLACKAIQDARILQESMEAFTTRLQNWVQQRMSVRYVREFLGRFDPQDLVLQEELKFFYQKACQKPLLKATFQSALNWDYPPAHKQFLQSLLGEGTPGTREQGAAAPTNPVAAAANGSPAAAEKPPEEDVELLKRISSLPKEKRDEARTFLLTLFQKRTVSDLQLSWAFRAALRFELPDFIGHGHTALKHADAQVVEPAVEYLAWAQPDLAKSLAGTYLKFPHPRLKATALRILKQIDIGLTVSTLLSMVRSHEKNDAQAALQCLGLVDFNLLRDGLCVLLAETSDESLLKPILRVFEANNDPAHVYALFRLERELSGNAAQMVAETRKACQVELVSQGRLFEDALSTLEGEFSIRYQKEKARKAAPPTYAYAKQNKGSVFDDLLNTVSSLGAGKS